jgi:hypothetical protein
MVRVRSAAVAGLVLLAAAAVPAAQTQKPAAGKGTSYDITVKTSEAVYSGTTEMTVDGGKVTGTIHITVPMEITGKVAGTVKGGTLHLDYSYRMVQEGCTGNVKMTIEMPAKPGPANGTMEAGPCGDEGAPVTGTVHLTPAARKGEPAR